MDQKESILIPVEAEDFVPKTLNRICVEKTFQKEVDMQKPWGGLSGTIKTHVIPKVEQKIGIQMLNLLALGVGTVHVQYVHDLGCLW